MHNTCTCTICQVINILEENNILRKFQFQLYWQLQALAIYWTFQWTNQPKILYEQNSRNSMVLENVDSTKGESAAVDIKAVPIMLKMYL